MPVKTWWNIVTAMIDFAYGLRDKSAVTERPELEVSDDWVSVEPAIPAGRGTASARTRSRMDKVRRPYASVRVV